MSNMSRAVAQCLTHYHLTGSFPKGVRRKTRWTAEEHLDGHEFQEATQVRPESLAQALRCPLARVCRRFINLGLQVSTRQRRKTSKIDLVGYLGIGWVVNVTAYDSGSFHVTVYRFDRKAMSFYGEHEASILPEAIEDAIALMEREDSKVLAAEEEAVLRYMNARRDNPQDVLGDFPEVGQIARGVEMSDRAAWDVLRRMEAKGQVRGQYLSHKDVYRTSFYLKQKAA